jgi:hypothetical protein
VKNKLLQITQAKPMPQGIPEKSVPYKIAIGNLPINPFYKRKIPKLFK